MSVDTSLSTSSVEKDPLKRDFRLFLYVVWKHLGLPDPTPRQYEIAYYLQHGPKRSMISAFRGVGKSWITSAFVLWLLYCDPQLNILVVSASKERADAFSTFTLRLILEMDILKHLRPKEGQRFSKIAFDVGPAKAAHAPSVKSAGITGQIVGSRADIIIGDDVEVVNNSATQTLRDKLSESIKEFESIIKPLESARIIFLGTPQSEQTVYNLLIDRGYEVRIWTARYPTPKQRLGYGSRLAPSLIKELEDDPSLGTRYGERGAPTDPARFSNEDLLEREASIGRSTFALQFMLDTTLSDADRYPLKLNDLMVWDVGPDGAPVALAYGSDKDLILPECPNVGFNGDRIHKPFFVEKEMSPYQGVIMAIDPSGRGKDEMGYAVVGYLYGYLYLLASGGMQGGYAEHNLVNLAKIAKQWKVNKIITEPNFGDGMFDHLLKPVMQRIYPCTIEEAERSSSQKEARIIDTLEPVMNQHRLVVNKSIFEQDYRSTETFPPEQQNAYRLFYQLTRITRDKGSLRHDDRLDALALAVHYWTDRMAQDEQKAQQVHKDKAIRDEARKWVKSNSVTIPSQALNQAKRQRSNRGSLRGRPARSGSRLPSLHR